MNTFLKAVKAHDVVTVAALLDKSPALLHSTGKDGRNALHFLCGAKTTASDAGLQLLQLLLQKGMDINSIHNIPDERCNFPATPLWYAYTRGPNKTLYTWLLEHGATPDHCMFAIALNDDMEAAALFHKHGAPLEDPHGFETPFTSAYRWKRFAVAEWFLQHGANVNRADVFGDTVLMTAIKRRYAPEQVQLLLRHGADIHHQNEAKETPLTWARANGRKSLLAILQ